MKKLMKAVTAIMLTVTLFFATGCNKENNDSDVRVTTYTPKDITQTTAVCGGDVIVTQGLSLSELGVCWSTERNPTAEGYHLSTSNWSEPYVCTITGLESNTKYHVRAYALGGLEYYYGDDKTFTTESSSGGDDDGDDGGDDGGGSWNGHDYVDLGLPSGLLWATCNVGATAPEDYGDYFAWGETQPKEIYSFDTYQWYNGSSITKYTGNDGLTTLQPSDDAATANWGSGWRTPTKVQWQELLDNTTNAWTTCNDVNGRLFTSSNGNSLFLPAAGGRMDDELYYAGSDGFYWSSSFATDNPDLAWSLLFFSDYAYTYLGRSNGFPVRPVREN